MKLRILSVVVALVAMPLLLGAAPVSTDAPFEAAWSKKKKANKFVIKFDGQEVGVFKAAQPPKKKTARSKKKAMSFNVAKGHVTAEFHGWLKKVRAQRIEGKKKKDTRDISIVLNDNDGNELRGWNLYGCWPKQWKTRGEDPRTRDVITDEINFVVEEKIDDR